MGLQINHNVAALNAWRNLGVSNSFLTKSLEKLSSGYRINRGADDPAGLLISEQLRAQISGLDQAVKNSSDAISMVQTAEGALTEMNNMLNSIRTLAVHAANTGANDTNSIAADQTAVDKAIDSMQRIATTTKYAGKNLLDGSAGTSIDKKTAQASKMGAIVVGQVGASGTVDINITTVALQATYATTAIAACANGTLAVWVESGGVARTIGTYAVGSTVGSNGAAIASLINADSANTGIYASGNGTTDLNIWACGFGDSYKLRVVISSNVINAAADVNTSNLGTDVAGSFGGDIVTGSGLVLYGSSASSWSGTSVTLASNHSTITGALSIVTGALKFSLTDNAASTDVVSYSIGDMRSTKIGVVAALGNANGLDDVKAGAGFALATNASSAVAIIDDAINDVSTQRANLGAFQKYTLETTINNLGVTKENLTASESRVRDVDMAQEMMEFTKNQILVQAGTAMLAQANQLPQSVLQLLK
ncbi:MAG: flagellin [Candidatus Margulisbacteria bacterium]|nr:flagellin [Candidatus Margulisiibacteriota bacterium]